MIKNRIKKLQYATIKQYMFTTTEKPVDYIAPQ